MSPEEEEEPLAFEAEIPETEVAEFTRMKTANEYVKLTTNERRLRNLPVLEVRRVVPPGRKTPVWKVVDTAPPIKLELPTLPTREEVRKTVEEIRAVAKDWEKESVRQILEDMERPEIDRAEMAPWVKKKMQGLQEEKVRFIPENERINIPTAECLATYQDYSMMFAAATYLMDSARKVGDLAETDYVEMMSSMGEAASFLKEVGEGYETRHIIGQLRAVKKSLKDQRRFGSIQKIMARIQRQRQPCSGHTRS
jgi:hypothetical protein